MIVYAAIVAVQVALIIDVIRHGANRVWIMALMFLPMASTIAYLIVEVLPRMKHNRHLREAHAQIVDKLDPERELRAAREALDIAQTSANRVRYADALVAHGRMAEALPFYRDAIGSGKADYRTGEKLARCQYLSDKNQEALATLDAMTPPSAQATRIGSRFFAHASSKISAASARRKASTPNWSSAIPATKCVAATPVCCSNLGARPRRGGCSTRSSIG